jgi:hypothetical protein
MNWTTATAELVCLIPQLAVMSGSKGSSTQIKIPERPADGPIIQFTKQHCMADETDQKLNERQNA